MEKKELIDRIKIILKGIDETECEDVDGWWETSTGAEFGSEKLAELIKLIDKNV